MFLLVTRLQIKTGFCRTTNRVVGQQANEKYLKVSKEIREQKAASDFHHGSHCVDTNL